MATLTELKNALDGAKLNVDISYAAAQTNHSGLTRCVGGKGDNRPLPAGSLPTFPAKANAGDCRNVTDFPSVALATCKTDCCSGDSCRSKVNGYNTSIDVYNSYNNAYNIAKSAYETALQDPALILEQEKEKSVQYTKNAIIIIIVVAILAVVGYFLWRKYGK